MPIFDGIFEKKFIAIFPKDGPDMTTAWMSVNAKKNGMRKWGKQVSTIDGLRGSDDPDLAP